ncbi:sigma 54-interacting transcriptional regulator [Photobacterium nomapromontoriensis]|uniref:sigma 54-interacting transcriptional regulator n=1 Tax=Photobacterium nomapromontoriensis TaxID=2910237 RepID=UPI003D14262D
MNTNILSSVESRVENIKSPEMIKDFIKTITKINHLELFNHGVFIFFSHDFISLSLRGCRETKDQLQALAINVGTYWYREEMGLKEPSVISRGGKSAKLTIISVPVSHPTMGILGYVSYLCDAEKNVMQAGSLLTILADYLGELELNRRHRMEDTANNLFIEYQQSCFLMLDNEGFIVHASKDFYTSFNTESVDIINYNLFEFFIFPPKIKCKITQNIPVIEENIDFDFSGEIKHLSMTFNAINAGLNIIVFCAPKVANKKSVIKSDNRLLPTLEAFETHSPLMRRVINSAKEAVKNTSPIYILGEEGTGKRSLALTIHNSCNTFKDGPFIAVNLHSVSKADMSDLLLGAEGSDAAKSKFELANGGTLYIERIDLLPGVLQAALTHIILTKTLFDINTNTSIDLNFRLITSSIKPLDDLVHERKFCPSLYFYLTGATLSLPSLHERAEDIPYLINKKLKTLDVSQDTVDQTLSQTFQEYALNRTWAGNMAELFKWVEHTYLNKDHLLMESQTAGASALGTPIQTLEELEKREISNALSILNRKYVEVAEQLGISQSTLRRKIAKYGI